MTKIKKAKGPYETEAMVFDKGRRNVIIKLEPNSLVLRAKRKHEEFRIPYGTIFILAVKASVDFKRKNKKAKL